MTDKLISLLKTVVDINEVDTKLIEASFEQITAKKNEVLVEYDLPAKYAYFVVSGFVRVFHYKEGVEITNQLASENHFVTSYLSFISNVRSEMINFVDSIMRKKIHEKNR